MPCDVEDLAKKYMRMLGMPSAVPRIIVRDNLGSRWLGQTRWRKRRSGTEIWIELQAKALDDERTCERIIAHEIVHCVELMTAPEEELIEAAIFGDVEHGPTFHKLAATINAEMGEDFVTEESDRSYEIAEPSRPFFVLVERLRDGRLAWSWFAKETPHITSVVRRKTAEGAVLAGSTSLDLLAGVKIRKGKIGVSVAQPGSDAEAELQEILKNTERATELSRPEALKLVTEAQRAVNIAVNTHQDDYAAEATALLAAVMDAKTAGCTDAEIRTAKGAA